MRLLDRYLLRELLMPLGCCLSGFLVFWISFDLFSELDEFQDKQLQVVDVVFYYIAKLPELLAVVMPVALLLAMLYSLTNHARHQELTAMRAAGVSLWRLAIPYLAVGLVFSLGLFYLNEALTPGAVEAAQKMLQGNPKDQPGNGNGNNQWRQNLNFRNDSDNRIWNIGAYNVETFEMIRPQVEWRLPDGRQRQIIAERALWTNGHWTFFDVIEFDYKPGIDDLPTRSQTNVLAMAELSETPVLIRSEIKVGSLSTVSAVKRPQLSIAEIRNYLMLHRELTPDKHALLHTQLQGRLAEPWTCLVVVLIALPFGAASGKRNVFVGVANSIFICFAYFVLLKLGLALGTGNYMPPWLAAWLPNVLFGGLGIVMTHRLQ